ncbi:MAG: 5'-methylthioadenosine/adenosylhomocysteine nucleosidase [Clostridia bacterium]|nr:5'-methylthioadenosine/adenosylhomocysteine nucleosidase [Clostridia bacterium]
MIQKADIGIICAMEVELNKISEAMGIKLKKEISGVEFLYGTLEGKNVVCAVCGVGKVFAAICTEAMILNFVPGVIVNSGVAGGLSESLSICDAVVAESLVQHDMDTSPLGDPVGLLSGINVVNIPCDKRAGEVLKKSAEELSIHTETGVIATGDQFISGNEKKEWLKKNFDAKACEMEGGAVAHVCYVNKVKCAVLRTISDGGNDDAKMDFPAFCKKASDVSSEIMKRFVREYND